MDHGDVAWILTSSALVLLMTPGLAFFYGGLVRRKNVLNTMMGSFGAIGVASVMWVIVGYTLAFGPDIGGVIGNLKWFGFSGVDGAPSAYASNIPDLAFAAFQMMFAIITPALITGAVVERMKFSHQMVFTVLWSLIVYYPLAHMIWGEGGFLRNLGALDFAGGTVVHISSGFAALVACIMLGKRKNSDLKTFVPHNIPFVLLGAGLLMFGWFGFNAGSALGSNTLAVHAFMTTGISGAAAMVSWMMLDRYINKKITALGSATGLIVGLAAVTPASGFVPIWAAIIIGAIASPLSMFFIMVVKKIFKYDDSLDVFGCHGIGGVWGVIATGLFATSGVNPAVTNQGVFFGGSLILPQLAAAGITIALSVAGTFVIIKALALLGKSHVTERDENVGLDHTEHGESAYPSFTGLD
jgi:Amt family ammonium transporter